VGGASANAAGRPIDRFCLTLAPGLRSWHGRILPERECREIGDCRALTLRRALQSEARNGDGAHSESRKDVAADLTQARIPARRACLAGFGATCARGAVSDFAPARRECLCESRYDAEEKSLRSLASQMHLQRARPTKRVFMYQPQLGI
jgi:hypothetical protein